MTKHDYKKQGKANRASGRAFELKVRKDLESKGWIVAKWTNQVDLEVKIDLNYSNPEKGIVGKALNSAPRLVPHKPKFNPFTKTMMMMTSGFPDFIAYKYLPDASSECNIDVHEIIGIEAKSNGTLSAEEKEKCKWLIQNKVFSKILIASKGEKRGSINYKEFVCT